MRILYDGEIFSMQPFGGINRYFTELIGHLPDSVTPILTTAILRDEIFPSHPRLQVVYYKRFGFHPGRLSYLLERYYFRMRERIASPDIEHPTFYRLLTRRPIRRRRAPVVLTVYDLLHLSFPDQLDPRRDWAPEISQAIRNADALIAISHATKRDLISRLSIPPERITVIGLAASLPTPMASRPPSAGAQPYFLFVGSRGGYKNFTLAIKAFATVATAPARKRDHLTLNVVGAPFVESEQTLLEDLGISDRVLHHGEVDDQRLANLLHHSVALLYPSRHEGYGLPALEAISCGTTVIAANCSSLPEVVGSAGMLVNPESKDELVAAMDTLLDHPDIREKLIATGKESAGRFSWEATATQTYDLYRSLCS